MRKPKVHRAAEKEGLNAGQKLMLEDGVPIFLMMTDEARKQAWIDRPPRAMPANKGGYSRYRDPETERLARLAEIDALNRRDQFFATAPKKERVVKIKPTFGAALYITAVTNKRKEGTKAHKKVEALKAYMKKNPTASVADVFRDTIYQKNDYQWDFDRGDVKVDTKPKGGKK
jgi:hypothetical protein